MQINLNKPCPFWKEEAVCSSQGCSIDTKLSDIHFPTFLLVDSVYKAWEYDDNDFCLLENDKEGVYVDLIENPERFTGYAGPSANRIWTSIYQENCFNLGSDFAQLFTRPNKQRCIELQLLYRIISGLHSSISIHLADQFFNPTTLKWVSLEVRRRFITMFRNGILIYTMKGWENSLTEFKTYICYICCSLKQFPN